jgi:glycosyltransferase involved in cell wall biosynthesis
LKVSVIIPSYNHEKFLQSRIESVLDQKYNDIEIIILDDNSSDNSKEIIEKYRGHPKIVRIIYNQENSGSTFKQWQKGISHANGDLIWIAESDYVADKYFLEKLINLVNLSENVSLAFVQSIKIDFQDKVIGKWYTQDNENEIWKSNFVMNGKKFIKHYLIFQNYIPNASAVIFKKQFVGIEKIIDTSFKINGDWMFWTSILRNGNLVYCSEILNKTRFHVAKGSTKNINNFNNILETYKYYVLNINLIPIKIKNGLMRSIFYNWASQNDQINKGKMLKNTLNIVKIGYQIDKKLIPRIFKYNSKVMLKRVILKSKIK